MKKKSKAGMVYILKLTYKDRSNRIYAGQTGRTTYERIGEHIKGKGGKYTSKAIYKRLLGSAYFPNRYKTERTIKKMSRKKKLETARIWARKYKEQRKKK
ncbi:hypothetical protein ACFLZ7_01920 [Nanoarchaeota archaeon]